MTSLRGGKALRKPRAPVFSPRQHVELGPRRTDEQIVQDMFFIKRPGYKVRLKPTYYEDDLRYLCTRVCPILRGSDGGGAKASQPSVALVFGAKLTTQFSPEQNPGNLWVCSFCIIGSKAECWLRRQYELILGVFVLQRRFGQRTDQHLLHSGRTGAEVQRQVSSEAASYLSAGSSSAGLALLAGNPFRACASVQLCRVPPPGRSKGGAHCCLSVVHPAGKVQV